MPGPFVLIVASTLALPNLTAAAAQSPRPQACRGVAASGLTMWEAARQPAMVSHCRWLARGYAQLGQAPARALLAAEKAERMLPGRVAPLVLAGRALNSLGKHQDAHARFAAAVAKDKTSLEEPAALLAFAQSAERAGKPDDAKSAYRALVPRIALLEHPWRRQTAAVEAGFSSMDSGELPKAIGVLTEARRRENVPGLSNVVAATLALALDRHGRAEEARGVAQEVGGAEALRALAEQKQDKLPSYVPVLSPGQLWACVALLEERADPTAARAAWRAYLKSPAAKGPFRKHAETHLARLTGPKRTR